MKAEKELLIQIFTDYQNELSADYSFFVEKLGVEGVYNLCENFGGCQIYIPTTRRFFSSSIKKYIKDSYDGFNGLYLCKQFDFTTRSLRQIVE